MTDQRGVGVLNVMRAEIERAGGEAYPAGRVLIAARAAVAELIEATAEVYRISERKHDAWDRLRAALSNVTASKGDASNG